MSNVIELVDLDYKNIFKNLSIPFEKNIFYSISGSNNSGKTTLIRILKKEISVLKSILLLEKDINNYKIDEITSNIGAVIPLEITFIEDTLEEELAYFEYNDKDLIDYIFKGLKIKKLLSKKTNDLTKKEIILSQIALSLIRKPKLLLLDCISSHLSMKEIKDIYKFLRDYQAKYDLTVISTTLNLEESLLTDYLYIIDKGEIVLEGRPLSILEKDNILNKIGLNIPFMIDLSVKLRDYELIDSIELDKERLIDNLWK